MSLIERNISHLLPEVELFVFDSKGLTGEEERKEKIVREGDVGRDIADGTSFPSGVQVVWASTLADRFLPSCADCGHKNLQ